MHSPRLAMGACLLAIFTTIFASHLPTPLYAVWQQAWGFSSTALTAVFSVYVLGVVLTLLTMGSLSDQIGRRQMVIPGLLFILVGSTLFMFAGNINHLGVARLITGIGTGLVTGAATAAVVEMMTDGNWARGATFAALAFTLGVVPLAVTSGAGAGSSHAIGTGVIGGMLTATVLVIFWVPLFYVLVSSLFSRRDAHNTEEKAP